MERSDWGQRLLSTRTYSAKVHRTITEIRITSLQIYTNITPSKASLHYLWNDVRIWGETRSSSTTHSRAKAARKHVNSVHFSSVRTLKIHWSSKRRSAKSFWNCMSVCVFPFPEGELLMLNCGILFNTCFGSSFFGEGAPLEFSSRYGVRQRERSNVVLWWLADFGRRRRKPTRKEGRRRAASKQEPWRTLQRVRLQASASVLCS